MDSFDQFLNDALNNEQRRAVTTPNNAILVIAGAGSGKTRIITARIAHLIINKKVSPGAIIALTFTNKAADEMRERIRSFLGIEHQLPFVGTFHSYCLLLLRSNPQLLGYQTFSILDTDDQESILKKIIQQYNLEKRVTLSQITHQISQIKNRLLSEDDVFVQPIFKDIYLAYEDAKEKSHSLDFDDLLLKMLTVFKTNQAFAERFKHKIQHILVDEYQDTNSVQHELLKHMGHRTQTLDTDGNPIYTSICAVGDEDQSIYSWRGATVTNMLNYKDDFSPVELIKVEQNYRSVDPILQAANAVIENNSVRTPKQLWSTKQGSQRILSITAQSGYQEAELVTRILESVSSRIKRNSIAILYRTHFQSRTIEEALMQKGIAYHMVGGIRFYERKEIKDILAYLRLIVNPFDKAALFRVINCPNRGLGQKFELLIQQYWTLHSFLDFKQLLTHALTDEELELKTTHAEGINVFLDVFDGLTTDESISKLVDAILERTAYISFLKSTLDSAEAETKIENVKELLHSIGYFERTNDTSKNQTVETFLHEIALMNEKINTKEEQVNCVQMMTLHAVKGLEFDVAIIVGLEEGLLPSTRSLNSLTSLEEERRLFYVGMTRAREYLVLLSAQSRITYGQITDQLASRFLSEIPKNLVSAMTITSKYKSPIQDQLTRWFSPGSASSIAPSLHKPTPVVTYGKTNFSGNSATTSAITEKPVIKPSPAHPSWKKNAVVSHSIFGMGIIKDVEAKGEEYYVTARFGNGDKKILSKFLKLI